MDITDIIRNNEENGVTPDDCDPTDVVRSEQENTERVCASCGRPLAGCLEGWTQDDVCSGRCWADLFGEP